MHTVLELLFVNYLGLYEWYLLDNVKRHASIRDFAWMYGTYFFYLSWRIVCMCVKYTHAWISRSLLYIWCIDKGTNSSVHTRVCIGFGFNTHKLKRMYTRTHEIQTRARKHTNTAPHVHLYACLHTDIHTRARTHARLYTHTGTHLQTYRRDKNHICKPIGFVPSATCCNQAYIYIYIYIHTYTHIHVYLYTYTNMCTYTQVTQTYLQTNWFDSKRNEPLEDGLSESCFGCLLAHDNRS